MKLSQLVEWQQQMLKAFGDHEIEIAGQKPNKDEELRVVYHNDGVRANYTIRNVKIR